MFLQSSLSGVLTSMKNIQRDDPGGKHGSMDFKKNSP